MAFLPYTEGGIYDFFLGENLSETRAGPFKFRFNSDLVQKYMPAPAETEPDGPFPYMGDRKFNPLQFCYLPQKTKYRYHVEEWVREKPICIRYRINETRFRIERVYAEDPPPAHPSEKVRDRDTRCTGKQRFTHVAPHYTTVHQRYHKVDLLYDAASSHHYMHLSCNTRVPGPR